MAANGSASLMMICSELINTQSFEERAEFIETYRPNYVRSESLRQSDVYKRRRYLHRHVRRRHVRLATSLFTVDNVYEHFVFKNTVAILNKMYGTAHFTIGHHIPLGRGGHHHRTNWFIQLGKENHQLGDEVPKQRNKMGFKSQVKHLKDYMKKHEEEYQPLVDLKEELEYHLELLKEVY
jgi:hypothetical protein